APPATDRGEHDQRDRDRHVPRPEHRQEPPVVRLPQDRGGQQEGGHVPDPGSGRGPARRCLRRAHRARSRALLVAPLVRTSAPLRVTAVGNRRSPVRCSGVNPKAVLMAREPNSGATPALVPVANRPLLCHALDWLAEGGVSDVAIMASDRIAESAWEAVGDGSEWGFKTRWRYHAAGESFGEALAGLARFAGDGPVVLHEADSLIANRFSVVFGDSSVDAEG